MRFIYLMLLFYFISYLNIGLVGVKFYSGQRVSTIVGTICGISWRRPHAEQVAQTYK